MRRKSFEDVPCSVAQFLEVAGEWWTMLVIRDAFLGVTRFDDFQTRLGISRNVLTQRLEHLVGHGVFERVAYQENPPRYDYRLTDKGRAMWTVVNAMRQWGDDWAAPDGPPVVATHKACGHQVNAVTVCDHCGERLGPHTMTVSAGPGDPEGTILPPHLR
ncbi:winged helix-turn-helix transcriptional regulator [Yinghuangia seranimata]|uniref:winged helix-turn-helix transcriptional regulator n=1 Tax=Yinghuangia seranimata TaxID=408067 RepID=UPI00248C1C67|nr:helix-turn-helix domain-containing protein [Yinghuangia seranimata]MDI2125908.1 helix-turn-helix domain-containing protein [Yinghuangia seranimata]